MGVGQEFSERKGTALWNVKIAEDKAISIAKHLAEGCSFKSTARLVEVDPETARRLNCKIGGHSRQFHKERVWDVVASNLQADERWGFACNKQNLVWEAELIDPMSKFVIAHEQGLRDKTSNWAIAKRTPRSSSGAATARMMNSTQRRKTLAFARHSEAKLALGWWTLPVYNWCRPHRMLRSKVEQYYGQSKYVERTPAMAVGVAREILTEEMALRTQVFQSKGWR